MESLVFGLQLGTYIAAGIFLPQTSLAQKLLSSHYHGLQVLEISSCH